MTEARAGRDEAGSAQSSSEGKTEPGIGSAEQPQQQCGVFLWTAGKISSAGSDREEEILMIGVLWMEGSTGEVECLGLWCKKDEWPHRFAVLC